MTESPPLVHVIPLRPDAPAPAARGWHGMMPRPLTQYTQADYAVWVTADPAGNAVLVDVALWSPAAKAGIMTGDWIVSLNDKRFDLWEEHGAPVGAHVHIIAYRSAIGPYTVDVVMAPQPVGVPRQRQRRPATYPKVAAGRHLGAKERLQWESAMYDDPALTARARDLAVRLAARYANARNMAWPSRATLARDLGVSTDTIDRAKKRLTDRGWAKWMSGRRTGESNRYWLTWPAGR